jgi:hypothetical protein
VRYIHAHIDAPNPFVEGQLSLNGPTYHSEIHAASIVDIDIPPPLITANILRLLDTDYMGYDRVDEALGELSDRSLRAEVNRYRRLEHKRKAFQESIRRLEDQMFTTDVERRMCVSQLEAARVLRFAKRCPTWTRIMWMQLLRTQLWFSDTRYSNTRSTRYVRRRRSTSTNIDKR